MRNLCPEVGPDLAQSLTQKDWKEVRSWRLVFIGALRLILKSRQELRNTGLSFVWSRAELNEVAFAWIRNLVLMKKSFFLILS